MKYIVEETMKMVHAGILRNIIFEEDDPTDKLVLPAVVDGIKIVCVYDFPAETMDNINNRLKDYDLIIEEGIQSVFQRFANSSIKTVSIPSSLGSISPYFCFQCEKLEKVTIAENSNLKEIEKNAFTGCYNLLEFTFPEGLIKIDSQAFARSGIETVGFPENSVLQNIGSEVFRECGRLKLVDLSSTGLEKISGDAFSYCVSLKKVIFPKTLITIAVRAFFETDLSETSLVDCEFLDCIETEAFSGSNLCDGRLPPNIRYISKRAFSYSKIKVLTLNPNIRRIGTSAFVQSPLEEIENMKYLCNAKIESFAFSCCKFKKIIIPNCYRDDEAEIFAENYQLKTVRFEEDVEEVPRGMFKNCCNLKTVEFNPKLRYIRESAFANTNIEELDFSKCDCLTVEDKAFYDRVFGYKVKASPYTCIRDKIILKYTETVF